MKKIPYLLILVAHLFLLPAWAQPTENTVGKTEEASKPTQSAQAPSPQVYEYQLENGLTLWVKPDHRAPTVTHMVWYRVGSRDEVDGTSGVAHVLEHMMFRGSQKIPEGGFSRRVAELGGDDNAFTSYDMTAYYQQIPKQALPEMMALEADRMLNLTLKQEDFLKELEVVKEERRMRTDENPRSQLWERLQATIYMADPYRRPIIGWMSDLDAMTVKDAKDFYQRWYRPDNAVVIIVGDVQPEQILREAKKTYGKVKKPSTPLLSEKPRIEPEQKGIKRIEHLAPAAQSYVLLTFKVPALVVNTPSVDNHDAYALTMLSAVLGSSTSARLHRNLVQGEGGKRVADSAGAGYGLSARGPVTFTLYGVPADGISPTELEQALRAEVSRIAQEGVDAKELERIKIQWVASQVYEKDSQMAQAQDLGGNWILALPPAATDDLIEQLRKVTGAQVQQVAQQYFGDDALSVGVLRAMPVPQKSTQKTNE